MNVRKKFMRVLDNDMTSYIVLFIIFIFLLSPLVFMFFTAFKTPAESELWPPTIFPHDFSLGAFRDVLFSSKIPKNLQNSIIITLSTVAIVTVVATFTAYALSRYKYRGSRIFSYSFLATRIIPPISLTIPFFMLFGSWGLLNTKLALIILNTYLTLPIITWLLINSFNEFPDELIDSARVDGASRNQTFFHVVLPPMAITIAAGAIVTFLFTWNEFLYALLFTSTRKAMPLTVGIFEFVGDEVIEWTRLCAVGVIASLPSIIFFIFAQRYIVKGLTAGAVKGRA